MRVLGLHLSEHLSRSGTAHAVRERAVVGKVALLAALVARYLIEWLLLAAFRLLWTERSLVARLATRVANELHVGSEAVRPTFTARQCATATSLTGGRVQE